MKRQTTKKLALLMVLLLFSNKMLFAQDDKQAHKVVCIGFYNFENLFDTLDTEGKNDEEFLPSGKNLYNTKVYTEKLGNLSQVIGEMGTELTPDGPAILGVAEIENRSVLEDFAKQPKVKDRNYQVVHFESLDKRGVDVALLYNPKYFTVLDSGKITPKMFYDQNPKEGAARDTVWTRDMLWVKGKLEDEVLYVIVCHWPSRAAESRMREEAAKYCMDFVRSVQDKNPKTKIIIMGDLNDDPVSPSVKDVVAAKGDKKEVKKGGFFNPWWDLYNNGIGTLAYRDAWNLFDQILVSHSLIQKDEQHYYFYKNEIFKKPYLVSQTGKFKGYPFRTYSYGKYIGGYSDHFPTYIFLVKKLEMKP
jgi:predicted extracellular nuclease